MINKGPSVKDIRKNLEKIYPFPLSTKCPHWLNPPCPCGHNINFEKPEGFCTKKCGFPHPFVHKMSALDNPLRVNVSFMDRL